MIKDIFTFKKKSWHMQLMTLIWGFEYYNFRNMCPYFWLSVLNILIGWWLILPFKLFGKIVIGIISYFKDSLEQYEEKCRFI